MVFCGSIIPINNNYVILFMFTDMDKAKVLEIIEPNSDIEGKMPTSSFDPKKIRTDSLDDADDLFPEKDVSVNKY